MVCFDCMYLVLLKPSFVNKVPFIGLRWEKKNIWIEDYFFLFFNKDQVYMHIFLDIWNINGFLKPTRKRLSKASV